jgi:poly(3-hydroxybutyrate) depolymerase
MVDSPKHHARCGRLPSRWPTLAGLTLALAAGLVQAQAPTPAAPLSRYSVDRTQIGVSGLSSGGYMAVQFHVAFSATVRGAGVFAGGPYFCAQGSVSTALGPCMAASGSTQVPALVDITLRNAASRSIDPTANLTASRVYLFSGSADTTVRPSVMNDLVTYYSQFVGTGNLVYKNDLAAEHAMPTDQFGNACGTKRDPFINNCGYDGAGAALQWIHGPLAPRNDSAPTGRLVAFDQSEFIANPQSRSLSNFGWLYVPASCEQGRPCKLHVVFHGCKQHPNASYFDGSRQVTFGDTYARHTGYNRWADTNDLLVLYPQAYNGPNNPNGCWDWWGYDDPNYAKQTGRQMAAVKAMVDRVAGGLPPANLAAPTGVVASAVTDTSVSLAWNAVNGAAGYTVTRDDRRLTDRPIGATTFTDSGLAAGSRWSYVIRAVDAAGAEGPSSAPLVVSTTGSAPVCFRSSNFDHVREARATTRRGRTFAVGSGQDIGLYNVFVVTTLRRSAPGQFALGTCP